MNWQNIENSSDLAAIKEQSKTKKQLIFKHSTRCSISSMALSRLERSWNLEDRLTPHFLDLLSFRTISNQIAEDFQVEHASPQVLIIENEKCIYHNSHNAISIDVIQDFI